MNRVTFIALLLSLASASFAWTAEPTLREWTVDGVKREALIFAPKNSTDNPTPVVFGFHGHGGSMRNAARSFRLHEVWPEAIVVYMQGLNTPGRLTDPEGKKPGWQSAAGDQGDRDLKFFDAVFESLKKDFKPDLRRVFCTGHSNGGGFTYLLWAERGEQFTAFAPSAAAGARAALKIKAKPALHLAGRNDELVKFEWQQRMIDRIKTVNECTDGKKWELDASCTIYPSATGTPIVTYIHDRGHKYPDAAPEIIAKFFKSQTKPE